MRSSCWCLAHRKCRRPHRRSGAAEAVGAPRRFAAPSPFAHDQVRSANRCVRGAAPALAQQNFQRGPSAFALPSTRARDSSSPGPSEHHALPADPRSKRRSGPAQRVTLARAVRGVFERRRWLELPGAPTPSFTTAFTCTTGASFGPRAPLVRIRLAANTSGQSPRPPHDPHCCSPALG